MKSLFRFLLSVPMFYLFASGQAHLWIPNNPLHIMKVPNGTITVNGQLTEPIYATGLNGAGPITLDPICCDAGQSGNSPVGSTLKVWAYYDDQNLYISALFIDDMHWQTSNVIRKDYYNDDAIEFYLYPPDYGDICSSPAGCAHYIRMFKSMESDNLIFIIDNGQWPAPLYTVSSISGFDWQVSSVDGLIWQSEMKIAWTNQWIKHSGPPSAGMSETWGFDIRMDDNDGLGTYQFPFGGDYLCALYGLGSATFCDPVREPFCGQDAYRQYYLLKRISAASANACPERIYSLNTKIIQNAITINPNPFMNFANLILPFDKSIVSIYNTSGEKVRDLTAGKSPLIWNGDDNQGRRLKSGVYLIKANIDDKILTKRVMILR